MNAAHTPTPRTDTAWQWAHNAHPWDEVVSATLSRQLERELAEAQDRIDDLTATGIHSCGNECKRPNCVLRRELAEARDQLNELRLKYRDHYEEAERLTREITDSRRFVKYSQDLITTLRCEKDEVIDQRDALAVALRALKELGPPSKSNNIITTALATLEGSGSNPAQKSPPTTP